MIDSYNELLNNGYSPADAQAILASVNSPKDLDQYLRGNPTTNPAPAGIATIVSTGPPIDVPGVPGIPGLPGGAGVPVAPPPSSFRVAGDVTLYVCANLGHVTIADLVRLGALNIMSLADLAKLSSDIAKGLIACPTVGSQPAAQNITIINQGIDQIAGTIGAAIHDAATSVADIVAQMVGNVTNSINNFAGGLGSWIGQVVNALKDQLGDIAKWIAGHAESIIDYLVHNVSGVIKDLASTLSNLVDKIASVVDTIAKTIQKYNDEIIQPLTTTILKTIQTISTLTEAVERDLHEGLAGILKIPTDIANGLSSLDATLQRTVEQIGISNTKTANDVLIGKSGAAVGDHLKIMSAALEGLQKKERVDTTFKDFVNLVDACNLTQLRQEIAKFKPLDGEFTGWVKEIIDVVFYVISLITAAEGIFEVAKECGLEKAQQMYPIRKLAAADTIEAYRRGFIDAAGALEELEAQGINQNRFRVMVDLDKQLMDVATLLDLRFRGIITDEDWKKGLQDLGFTFAQIQAMDEARFRLVAPSTVVTLYRYNKVSREAVTGILAENQYSDAEIQATLDADYRPPNAQEVFEGVLQRNLIGNLNLQQPELLRDLADIINRVYDRPDLGVIAGRELEFGLVAALRSEGLDKDAANLRMHAMIDLLPTSLWLQLYFRGHRTLTELKHVLNSRGLPNSLHADYIDAQRALIPFRTIPSMLTAGIISQSYAIQQLQAHGYDLTQANALLDYALKRSKTTKSTTAKEIHALSVSTAKEFWLQGAITEQQYHDILVAHGYDQTTANLTIAGEKLQAHAKERKENAQLIKEEALSGLITYEQALARLSNEGYTQDEIVKYARQLIQVKRATTKLPSEAELHQMLSHGVIDLPSYKDALQALGFAQKWVDAFAKLRGASLEQQPV